MNIRISGKWVLLFFFLGTEFILVAAYHKRPDRDRATIAFGATVVGAAFALYTYMRGIDEKRAETAHHFMERWTAPDMVKTRMVLMDIMEHRVDPASLVRTDATLRDSRIAVVSALNFLEELAIAVQRKSASEERLKDFYASIVQQSWAKLEAWIKTERIADNDPQYYVEFEKLAGDWKGKRKR